MNIQTRLALPLDLNLGLDVSRYAEEFLKNGHVRIPHILNAGAPELYRHLDAEANWMQLINKPGGGAHEIPRDEWRKPRMPEKARISREMYENACDGFQYCYSALRVPGKDETCMDPVLTQISRLLSEPAVKGMLSAITGISDPVFTDGQVTSYGPGDFLTGHDDDLEGSGRAAAFVLGLTPQWRLEWGGLLMFHELGEVPFCGLVPQFNTLDLFTVPRYHSVSLVSPAAPRQRYSITGWLSRK